MVRLHQLSFVVWTTILVGSCGIDLEREQASLRIWLVSGPAPIAPVTVHIEHEGVLSDVVFDDAEMVFVQSIAAGANHVWLQDSAIPARQSNAIDVLIFEGEAHELGFAMLVEPEADDDGDGVIARDDNCPDVANPTQSDSDGDGVGDRCDGCVSHASPDPTDTDGDGYGDLCDPDADGDGVLNVLDSCPLDALGHEDSDGDGVCDTTDNCLSRANSGQADCDGDGLGDACDGDIDGDHVDNGMDNCPYAYNPDQGVDSAGTLPCAADPSACIPGE